MIRLVGLLALVLLAAGLVVGLTGCGSDDGSSGLCGPGLPSDVPLGGMLLFATTRDFNSDIYYYHPAVEGGEAVMLRLTLTNEANPAMSSDGARTAFNSNWNQNLDDSVLTDDEIWIMTGDCGSLTQLTMNERQDVRPRFSPDGNWLVYQSSAAYENDDTTDVWIMRTDGTEATRVTGDGSQDYSPSFSPDGQRIAFCRRTVDTTAASGFEDTVEIWSMDLTGGDLTQLTQGDDAVSALFPTYSLDGTKIAFAAQPANSPADVWVMNADGTGATQLTFSTEGGSGSTRPSFSPDGQWIVYDHFTVGITKIFMISSTGGTPIQLTQAENTEGSDTAPFYSPVL